MLTFAAFNISPGFIVAVVVGCAIALERYTTLLDKFKKKSAADAASELAIADRRIERLEEAGADLRTRNQKLEGERSLVPILELLHSNGEQQAQILERLIHHNGSFKHMEEAMAEIVEGLKMLTGFIAELHDLPVSQPPPKGTG